MTAYARPVFGATVFRDAAGNAIDYGNRWGADGPPGDSYCVDDNPERFAPLHSVAEALIEYLVTTYDVDVTEGEAATAGFAHVHPAEHVVRAVRLTPRRAGAATLVITRTDYPGVRLHGGALFSQAYPACGCNACDETWQHNADDFEQAVFAITGGTLIEQLVAPHADTVDQQLTAVDGCASRSTVISLDEYDHENATVARLKLEALAAVSSSGAWLPWPRRASEDHITTNGALKQ